MRLHHVSIPAPADRIGEGRAFYGDLLGMEEIPQPATLDAGSVIWFRAGDGELHLFKHALEEPDTTGRHFCLAVDSVDDMRSRLTSAGVDIEETTPIHNRPRFFCSDPFGNRLEITELRGEYQ
jgi:catechol 2,3-dioxygenase-like lactoylglutathione lyase family enzyme